MLLKTAPCDQPIEAGPCGGSFERWAFDKERDQCIPFNYGGCKGNKNNYQTENACNYHCKKPGVGKRKYKLHVVLYIYVILYIYVVKDITAKNKSHNYMEHYRKRNLEYKILNFFKLC